MIDIKKEMEKYQQRRAQFLRMYRYREVQLISERDSAKNIMIVLDIDYTMQSPDPFEPRKSEFEAKCMWMNSDGNLRIEIFPLDCLTRAD